MAKIFSKILTGVENMGHAWRGEPLVMETKFGTVRLAGRNRQQAASIISQLQRTTEALTKSDIQRWRKAWQRAISVEDPNRQALYDIYRDAMADAHLSGCIEQRKGFVMSRSFNIENAEGEPQPGLKHYFDQEWFDKLCRLVLDAAYWGHSLIELGPLTTDGDGCPCYSGVQLVDRKFVIPEHHCFVTDLGQSYATGTDYRQPPYRGNLIEAGEPDSLGLLLKASLHTIPKKNVLAAWDVFAEMFGMPLRVATTNARDPKEIERINQMMERFGMAQWVVMPEGTTVQFVENAKSDAYNVYDRRVDRANSELSKLIIGQTMTIEDGSSLSQSQTHLKVLENLTDGDAKRLAYVVNNQLLPCMVRHGFPLRGMRFAWDESIDYTPEQQMEYEKMITDRYEVDPQYFADKYNMPVGERLQQATPFGMQQSSEDDKKDDHQKNFLDKNGDTSVVSCEHDGARFARFFD